MVAKSVLRRGAGEARVHQDSWEKHAAELRAAEKFCRESAAAEWLSLFFPTVAKRRQEEGGGGGGG